MAIGFDLFGIFTVASLLSGIAFFREFKSTDEDHQEALKTIGFFPKVLTACVILVCSLRLFSLLAAILEASA
jgi:hypothetical protein